MFVHDFDAFVHPDVLVEYLLSGGIHYGHARDAHSSCRVYHLAVECYGIQRGVIGVCGWPCMRERVSPVQVLWVGLVENVRARLASLLVWCS